MYGTYLRFAAIAGPFVVVDCCLFAVLGSLTFELFFFLYYQYYISNFSILQTDSCHSVNYGVLLPSGCKL